MNIVLKLFETAARADRAAIVVARIGLVVVLVWIGASRPSLTGTRASCRSSPTAR
jgi:hypothetical protein